MPDLPPFDNTAPIDPFLDHTLADYLRRKYPVEAQRWNAERAREVEIPFDAYHMR